MRHPFNIHFIIKLWLFEQESRSHSSTLSTKGPLKSPALIRTSISVPPLIQMLFWKVKFKF